MSGSNNESLIPPPPKAVVFSKSLLLTISIGVIFLVALYLFFLNHYSPKPNNNNIDDQFASHNVNYQEGERIILELQKQMENPEKFKRKKMSVPQKATLSIGSPNGIQAPDIIDPPDSKNKKQDDFLNAAANAEISVFARNDNNSSVLPETDHSLGLRPGEIYKSSPRSLDTNKSDYSLQNQQHNKVAFLKKAKQLSTNIISTTRERVLTDFELKAGTIIPATMQTAINSDLPGTMLAKVRRNIYDTVSGNHLIIPQGTTLIGIYDSQISFGQSRVLIAWSRLIFPDGSSFNLEGMPGADLAGNAGLHDIVNHQYSKVFGSALLFSIFSAASQLSQPQNKTDQLSTQQIIYGAIGQQISQLGAELIARNMNIQPTMRIRQGTNFNVLLTRDLVMEQPYA